MRYIDALGYLADIAILSTYYVMACTGRARFFHLANAIGAAPIIAGELYRGARVPFVLTVAFGAIGAAGFTRERLK